MKDDETKSFRLSSDNTISLKQDSDKTLPRASFTDLKVAFEEGLEDKETGGTESSLRYRRQHVLGKGGSGEIISAFDRKMNRSVAIKITNTTVSERSARVRFLREAQVTGQLSHPNVMPVYDIGTESDGKLFFTMKEVHGQSLAQQLRDGNAGSRSERLLVFRQICNAIAYAHSRGVLHRDIKPANVMVGEYGEVLVVDWGLCRIEGESTEAYVGFASDVTNDELLTRYGEVAGTPAYMAPEQARGENHKLDNRTDIYALGTLLYTLLTEHPPFKGDVITVLNQVKEGDFVPPNQRAPKMASRELSAIIEKAMSIEQEDRYPSVQAMMNDIQAYMDGRSVSVVKYNVLQLTSKWAARNERVVRPVGITVVLAILSFIVLATYYIRDLNQARDAAVAEAVRANAAERSAWSEALNGRAALATAQALSDQPATALGEFNSIREQMEDLDLDTLRVEIGMAILRRNTVLPSAIDTNEQRVIDFSFSPDMKMLAWVSRNEIRVLDVETLESIQDHKIPFDESINLGPWADGVPWVFGRSDSTIKGWHAPGGETMTLNGTECTVKNSFFSGSWVVLWCSEKKISIQNLSGAGGPSLQPFEAGLFKPVGVSHDGTRTLAEMRLEDEMDRPSKQVVVQQGEIIWENPSQSQTLSLSPSGTKVLITASNGFEIHYVEKDIVQPFETKAVGRFLWDLDEKGFRVVMHNGNMTRYALKDDEFVRMETHQLALQDTVGTFSANRDRSLFAFYSRNTADLFRIEANNNAVIGWNSVEPPPSTNEATTSADGQLLAMGTEDGRILVHDAHSGLMLWQFSANGHPVRGLSFSPDGSRLLSGHWDGRARIWDLAKGRIFKSIELPGQDNEVQKVTEVMYLDDGRVLLTGSDGLVGVWSVESGERLQEFTDIVTYAWDSVHSPRTNRVLFTNRNGNVAGYCATILDLNTGSTIHKLPEAVAGYGAAVSPDGQYFVVTAEGGTAWVLDLDGNTVTTLDIPMPPGFSAAWSADGSVLAISDFSGNYHLWATDDWDLLATFGQANFTSALMFEPNGRKLNIVTASSELYTLDLNGPNHVIESAPEWLSSVRLSAAENNWQGVLNRLAESANTSVLAAIWRGMAEERLNREE